MHTGLFCCFKIMAVNDAVFYWLMQMSEFPFLTCRCSKWSWEDYKDGIQPSSSVWHEQECWTCQLPTRWQQASEALQFRHRKANRQWGQEYYQLGIWEDHQSAHREEESRGKASTDPTRQRGEQHLTLILMCSILGQTYCTGSCRIMHRKLLLKVSVNCEAISLNKRCNDWVYHAAWTICNLGCIAIAHVVY